MKPERRALVFSSNTVTAGFSRSDPALFSALQQCVLIPLWPWELADQTIDVAIIIIDRPAQNAIKICANLRSQERFFDVPILTLLEDLNDIEKSQMSALNADIMMRPVQPQALQRYFSARVPRAAPATLSQMPDETLAQMLGPSLNGLSASANASREPFSASASPRGAAPQNASAVAAMSSALNTVCEPDVLEVEFDAPVTDAPPDIIPMSNWLLPAITVSPETIKGGVSCTACHGWECRREDIFCARCGAALAELAEPLNIIRFEPHHHHSIGQLIDFVSTGQNPVRLAFNVLASGQLDGRLSLHTQSGFLEGGRSADLLITLDARGLDLTTSYRAELEITTNEKGRLMRRIELLVEQLARPRLLAGDVYTFVVGAENEWSFELENGGGGTLKLVRVLLGEKPVELKSAVTVRGGHTANVCLRIPNLELPPGTYTQRMRWELEHYDTIEKDLKVVVVRPPRLMTQPAELDFGIVSTYREHQCALTLINSGGEELIIESVESVADWLTWAIDTPLAIPANATRIFDVTMHGANHLQGEHEGTLTIRSNAFQNRSHAVPYRVEFVEPLPYENYIGIDFGTTASCVAVLKKVANGLQPEVIVLDQVENGATDDPRIMPSVLFFREDGSVMAGRAALVQSAIQPANSVASIKRALGMRKKKVVAGKEYDPTQIAAKIIEQLIMRTEDSLFQLGQHKTPRRAIITVPVEFFDNQRRALLEACTLTGLQMETHTSKGIVLDEPRAAALYYLSKRTEEIEQLERERLLIFDFGGGTLDCVLIEISQTNGKLRFETLALGGDPQLGGEDIDWALVNLLAGWAEKEFEEFNIDCLGDEGRLEKKFRSPALAKAALETRAEFKRQAEMAKIALGKADAVDVKIQPLLRRGATPLQPFIMDGLAQAAFETTLTRADLEEVLSPFAGRAVAVVETVCQRAGLSPDDVDTVLHVGRTSKLPMVKSWINTVLSKAQDRSQLVEPKLCVALGAAYWGYIKNQPSTNIEFIPTTNCTIHDIGYLDTNMLKIVFKPVFAAQTEFPISKTVDVPGGKELIELRLAESRGKSTNGNWYYEEIGVVRIDTHALSEPRVAVEFALDENRMLQISVDGCRQQIIGLIEES